MPCNASTFLFGPIMGNVISLMSITCLACSSLFQVPRVVHEVFGEVIVWQVALVCGEGREWVSVGGGKSGISLRGGVPRSRISFGETAS